MCVLVVLVLVLSFSVSFPFVLILYIIMNEGDINKVIYHTTLQSRRTFLGCNKYFMIWHILIGYYWAEENSNVTHIFKI